MADLEGALRTQDVTVEPGDVLLFHTGWGALWDEDPMRYTAGVVPGEDPARPFVVPQTLNVKHGLFIMENLATEALAAAQVFAFMFVLTHHKTRGSTASGIAPATVV